MSFSLTVKLFAVVMAICIFGLFRPISCRVALSRSKDDLQSSEAELYINAIENAVSYSQWL